MGTPNAKPIICAQTTIIQRNKEKTSSFNKMPNTFSSLAHNVPPTFDPLDILQHVQEEEKANEGLTGRGACNVFQTAETHHHLLDWHETNPEKKKFCSFCKERRMPHK